MHSHSTTSSDLATLAADARAKRERAEITRARLRAGQATYEEAVADAKAFCAAAQAWHKARHGKSLRIDYRAFLR